MTDLNTIKTAKQIHCEYCKEPTTINKRITADRKTYCGKLCAALGLIQDTHDEEGIDEDTGVDALTALIERSFLDGPPPIPTKVRYCDTEAALESLWNGPLADRIAMVVIDDNGTPDWVPASDWVATPKALVTAAPNEPGELVTYTLESESLRAAQKAAEAFYVFFKANQDLRSIADLVESLRRPEIPAVTRSVISHIIEAVLLFERSACLERLAEITPQSEIDRVIEDLLRNGDDPEGRQ